MKTDVIFPSAAIIGIEMKPANSGVGSRIKIAAAMTAEMANVIDARWLLFDKERTPKAGYTAIELDYELVNVRMMFEVKGIDKSLDMYLERVNHFKVQRKGDGKKKSRRLMVSFVGHYVGSPFDLFEYLLKMGGAIGTCTLQPRQEELPLTEAATGDLVEEYANGKWTARIEVKAAPEGFNMTRRATAASGKLNQKPVQTFASEKEALECGAEEIRVWADKTGASGNRTDKKEAAKLSDWAWKFLQQQFDGKMAAAGDAVN
jgi:hypothetical protein